MGGIGFFEIVLVLVIAVVVWGGRLPEVARKAANYYVRIRNQLTQVRDEVMRHVPEDLTALPPATDIPVYKDEPAPEPVPAAAPPTEKKKRRSRPKAGKPRPRKKAGK